MRTDACGSTRGQPWIAIWAVVALEAVFATAPAVAQNWASNPRFSSVRRVQAPSPRRVAYPPAIQARDESWYYTESYEAAPPSQPQHGYVETEAIATDEYPGDSEAELRMRARQAVMHDAARYGGIAPIPSGFRAGRSRQVAAQSQDTQGALMPGSVSSPSDSAPAAVPSHGAQGAIQAPTAEPLPQGESLPQYPSEQAYPFHEPNTMPYEADATEWYADEGFAGDCPGECGELGGCANWCRTTFCRGNTHIALGVAGFKGPVNQGRDGSFGFQQAVNFGTILPLLPESGLGWQVGVRTIQANLSGASFTSDERNQTFFTTGFFRRNPYGLQAGVVFDLMQDDWYAEINAGQVRAEFSWLLPERHEWGYWFALGDSSDTTPSPIANNRVDEWTPIDLHAFFYRRRLDCVPGGTTRLFAGFSGDSDGFIGADARLPINRDWSVQSGFSYLIPNEPRNSGGNENEGWNLSLALVWTLGGHCPAAFAPLMDVADNGSFILDRVP